MSTLTCPQCKTEFHVPKCRLKRNRTTCSWKCKVLYHEPSFKKGHIPWNKGQKWSDETLTKIRKKAKERVGKANHMWKGDDVGYDALHNWVRRHRGVPMVCAHCGEVDGLLQWANISKEYLRDLDDWVSLCVKCHCFYDEWWIRRQRDEKGRFQ